MLKLTSIIFYCLVFLGASVYTYIWLADRATVKEVPPMLSYLDNYYRTHKQYPSRDEFNQKFKHLAEKLHKYSYQWNQQEPGSFRLQYPLNAKWCFAIGERQISEFTGTTYAYVISGGKKPKHICDN